MKLVDEDKIIDYKFGKQINIVKWQSTWLCIYTIMLQVIIVNYLFYNWNKICAKQNWWIIIIITSLSLSLSSVCLYISPFVIYLIVSQPWYMRFDQGETAADGCSAVLPWGPRYLCLRRMLCAKFGWNLPLVLQKYGRF